VKSQGFSEKDLCLNIVFKPVVEVIVKNGHLPAMKNSPGRERGGHAVCTKNVTQVSQGHRESTMRCRSYRVCPS
jgi:hypothetical protein